MSETIIRIENLSKEYRLGEVGTGTLSHDLQRWLSRLTGGEDRYSVVAPGKGAPDPSGPTFIRALENVNLEIRQGDTLGIIGGNGAGKSTLLKIISRITAPTGGTVKARGRIASLLEVGTGMHQELTGRENIYLNGAILGMKKREVAARFDEIVDFSGCGLFIDTPIKRYSTGMRVRLGFAVAAFLDAEVLIVDEVLAVGDLQFQRQCVGKMEEIGKSGRTILFVSHNMATLKVFCNEGIELCGGRITCSGPMNQVAEHYASQNGRLSTVSAHYVNTFAGLQEDGVKATLLEAGIFDVRGAKKPVINVDQDFMIRLLWQLNVDVPFLRLCIELVDPAGTVILMTEDTDTTDLHGKPRKPGIYSQSVFIPRLLLMPGIYSVNIFAGIPRLERLLEEDDVVQFEITENNTHLSSVTGSMRRGYISTPLKWTVEPIDA